MSARGKVVAIGLIAAACVVVYYFMVCYFMESVFRMQEKNPSATLGTWFRKRLYRRGYCIVKENGKVECCGSGEGIVVMMAACYQSLKDTGLTKEELRTLLKTGEIIKITDTTWEERDDENH